ncbi:hypothetical protein [Bartonella grahamii]|nr:hypothetical protein [Bartonella grahamii]
MFNFVGYHLQFSVVIVAEVLSFDVSRDLVGKHLGYDKCMVLDCRLLYIP